MSRGGQDEEQEAPDENVLASGNRMSSDSCWMRRQHESASAAFAAYGGYRFTVQRYGSNRWRAAIAAVNIMTAVNSIPAISALFPRATATGGPAFTLAVGGVNFVSSSVVRWNGSDRPTAFVSSGGVTAQIPAGDIAAAGTAAITVFNPGGGGSNSVAFSIGVGPVSVAVAADPSGKFGKFVYVANANSNDVSMYTIDATTGALTSTGTIAAGTSPSSVAVDPSGKFAYVANANSNDVSMYTIDAIMGALTSTGTIAAGTSPSS